MSSKKQLIDLPTNLIAFIYQFLSEKDMFMISKASKKFDEAFHKDFLMEQLVKRNIYFLPEDESRGNSWYDILKFLKKYKTNEKSGAPSNYKMMPYRGHKSPIEAFVAFENNYNFDSTIVSGDRDGNVFTWNLEVDEDDEDEKIMNCDKIIKAEGKIIGIEKLDNDKKMIIWTTNNNFYLYKVNLYKDEKFDKNSKRFELITQFKIDDVTYFVKQIYYDKSTDKIFLSANFSGKYKKTCVYAYNLKQLSLERYNFAYDKIQTELVQKDEAGQQAQQNNNMDIDDEFDLEEFLGMNHELDEIDRAPYFAKRNITNFVVCGNRLILYINKEPVKNKLIDKYNCKKLLPNTYFIDTETKLYKDYHVNLKYINDILKISEDKVGFIGVNNDNKLEIQIYSSENYVLLGQGILYSSSAKYISELDFLYSSLPNGLEFYYLINNNILYKVDLANFKQIKTKLINSNLKEVKNINCIESDRQKIVMASDELYVAIFDINSGEFWYIFLGGSLTVVPKSFVKHPIYKGFHIVKMTRNAVLCAHGNLIREYKFVFNKK